MNKTRQPFHTRNTLHNIHCPITKQQKYSIPHYTHQRNMFPSQYWEQLNFIQRALLVEQINSQLTEKFTAYADAWHELSDEFRTAAINYLEDESKPIVFYNRRSAL